MCHRDSAFMLARFGWKAAVAVVIDATVCALVLRCGFADETIGAVELLLGAPF
jgi:hypothetical protein